MGNQNTALKSSYTFNPQEWQSLPSSGETKVWRNNTTLEEVQEYDYLVNDESQYALIKSAYDYRYESDTLVAGRYFKESPQRELCSTYYKGKIYLEKISFRIQKIKDIPLQDSLHLYSQAFKGFDRLYQKYGYFYIMDDHIAINQRGVAKVWCNSDFSRPNLDPTYAHESQTEKSERSMIERILEIIDTRSVHNPAYNVVDYIIKSKPYKLQEAQRSLKQFSEQYRVPIPNQMESVLGQRSQNRIINPVRQTTNNNITQVVRFDRPLSVGQSTLINAPISNRVQNSVSIQNPQNRVDVRPNSIVVNQPLQNVQPPQNYYVKRFEPPILNLNNGGIVNSQPVFNYSNQIGYSNTSGFRIGTGVNQLPTNSQRSPPIVLNNNQIPISNNGNAFIKKSSSHVENVKLNGSFNVDNRIKQGDYQRFDQRVKTASSTTIKPQAIANNILTKYPSSLSTQNKNLNPIIYNPPINTATLISNNTINNNIINNPIAPNTSNNNASINSIPNNTINTEASYNFVTSSEKKSESENKKDYQYEYSSPQIMALLSQKFNTPNEEYKFVTKSIDIDEKKPITSLDSVESMKYSIYEDTSKYASKIEDSAITNVQPEYLSPVNQNESVFANGYKVTMDNDILKDLERLRTSPK